MGFHLRVEVLLPLLTLAALYGAGWLRLAHRSPRIEWSAIARLGLACGGLVTIALALLSPLDALAHRRFSAHMAQHMLLTMVAAPALLLADPFPMVLWGLPARARASAATLFATDAHVRRVWRFLTRTPIAWLVYALTMWLWHLPPAYDAAFADPLLHDVQHVTFLLSAVLFWWPVIDPAPRGSDALHPGWRIAYLVLAAFQGSALGLLLALSPSVLYASYAFGPAAPGTTALEDQAWGGVVMWAAGGAVEMAAVLILVFRFLVQEERAEFRPFP